MATFADMATLLLAFFIMLLSFSSIQESKFQDAISSLQGALGVMQHPPSVIKMPETILPQPDDELEDIFVEIQEMQIELTEEGLADQLEVTLEKDGIALRMKAPFLFAPANAELLGDSLPLLDKIAGILSGVPNAVRIEGHTDNVPISNDEFPSNWELSSSRAMAVLRRFLDGSIAPTRLSAVGYGEHRPRADNATEDGRDENRRVEIFVEYKNTQAIAGSPAVTGPTTEVSDGR